MLELGTKKMIAKKENGVGWMIFNQPEKHNAVAYEMWTAIPKIMADFEADPAVRVIVVTGAGERAFVSGADISEFGEKRSSADGVKLYNAAGDAAGEAIVSATKPTISKIRGICIGGGLGVALNTDIRICSDNSVFSVPAALRGLGYRYGGMKRLVDLVGPAFAKEIFYTAHKYTAEEARHMGVVNRVVPAAELDAYVDNYCATIARNAPLTIKAAKLTINTVLMDAAKRDMAAVDAAVKACFESEDYAEATKSFMEKRKPVFKGR